MQVGGASLKQGQITIVAGPPCSGKSAYVRDHAKPGEPVLDWDDIWAEVTGRPSHDRNVPDRAAAEAQTEQVFRARMESMTHGWIIRLAPRKQHRAIMRRIKGARTIVLAVPADECLRRLKLDNRPDKEMDAAGIRRWWAEYEPSTSPDEVVIAHGNPPGGRAARAQPHQ